MLAAIDKGLERVGVSVEDQKKKMVGCNFDGASVMLGSKSGVAQKLKEGWAITLCLFTVLLIALNLPS